jgi:hypothetical protein
VKFNLLQKQTSRREMLRGSVTLAGSAFLAHLFPATSLHASAAGYPQQVPSPADLLARMRAKFNASPVQTQKLADNITMLSGPGGSVVVLNGLDGKFVVDIFVAPAWPRLKEALDGLFDYEAIGAKYKAIKHETMTEAESNVWERIQSLIQRFQNADRIVLGAPMWNFGLPYKLKQLIS